MHKIRTPHRHKDGKIFSWLVLSIGLGMGMVSTVMPNFVKTIVKTDSLVSVFYIFIAITALVGSVISTIIFRKFNRTAIMKWGFFIAALALFMFIFVTSITQLSIIETARSWVILFLLIALALFVRDFASSGELAQQEGRYYRFMNIGFFIGPLIGGFLGARFNHDGVFILASFVFIIGLLYFSFKHVIKEHPAIVNAQKRTNKIEFFLNVKKFFENGGRTKAYLIRMFLTFWFGFERVYVPLYVISSGYLENMTGVIFALELIPYILLEVAIGKYADKFGPKAPVALGFTIMVVALIGIFFSPYPILNFALLLVANLGGSFIEPLQEFVLFKHLPKEEEESLYGVYLTADNIAFVLAPLLGLTILFFFPFKWIFLGMAAALTIPAILFYKTLKKTN